MIRRTIEAVPSRGLLAVALLCASLLRPWWLPASGAARPESMTGGSGMPSPTTAPSARPSNLIVTSSVNGMTIAARESALLATKLQVSGSLPTSDAGQTVEIEFSGRNTGWTWKVGPKTTVQGSGTYSAVWDPNLVGKFAVRALVGQAGAAIDTPSMPTIGVTVYRASLATLYGPGLYGRPTACGTILRRLTIGVANRTLPCGTPVAIFYRGRMLTVPVIDRGPYTHGVSWDLTMATGKALGIYQTETVGAAPLPPAG